MIQTIFDLVDSSGKQLYTKLVISPDYYGFAYSSSVVSADSIYLHECGASASISLIPNSYSIRLFGNDATTQFNICLPTSSDNTTQSAANFVVSWSPNNYSATASYSISAGTAVSSSYALTASYSLNSGIGAIYAANYLGSFPTFTPNITSGSGAMAIDISNGAIYYYYNSQWN
jgi:hypothetical protein